MSTNTGGPAFPAEGGPYSGLHANAGMTLRDYFAGQALASAWAAMDRGYYEGDNKEVAECAYQMADAMLAAREAKQ